MLNYIEVITLLFGGYFICRELETTNGKPLGWFAKALFILVIIELFFLIRTFSVIGSHVYSGTTLIIALNLIIKQIPKNKLKEHDKAHLSKSSYAAINHNEKRYQGINRPEPQKHLMNLGNNDVNKQLSNLVEDTSNHENSTQAKTHKTKITKNSKKLNIAFSFINSDGDYTYREIDVKKANKGQLFGYCHLRSRMRTFRLDRIRNSEIINLDTGVVLNLYDWLKSLSRSKKDYYSGR